MLIQNVNIIVSDLILYVSDNDSHNVSYVARLIDNMLQQKVSLASWGIKYPPMYEPVNIWVIKYPHVYELVI